VYAEASPNLESVNFEPGIGGTNFGGVVESVTCQRRVERRFQPAKVPQPNVHEQKLESEPQTVTLPGRSGAVESLSKRLIGSADNASSQSRQLDLPRR